MRGLGGGGFDVFILVWSTRYAYAYKGCMNGYKSLMLNHGPYYYSGVLRLHSVEQNCKGGKRGRQ